MTKLTNLIMGAGLFFVFSFLPIKNYSQTEKIACEKKQKYDIFFNSVPSSIFFTKTFLDSLNPILSGKSFNNIEVDVALATDPFSKENNFNYDFYLKSYGKNPLSVYLNSKGDIVGASDLTENIMYSKMYLLYKQDVFQKEGLEKAGILDESKKAYKEEY